MIPRDSPTHTDMKSLVSNRDTWIPAAMSTKSRSDPWIRASMARCRALPPATHISNMGLPCGVSQTSAVLADGNVGQFDVHAATVI